MNIETRSHEAIYYKTGGTVVDVTVTGTTALERAERLLAGFPNGVQKAAKRAIHRTANSVRASSTRAIRFVYAISQAGLRAEENVHVFGYSHDGQITAMIHYAGRKIPLYRYDGTSPLEPTFQAERVPVQMGTTWRLLHPGAAAAAHQRRDTRPTTFFNAFVAQFGSGHIGVFERTGETTRTGKPRLRELMGKSYPEMVGNREVLEELSRKGFQTFEKNLEHETNAILNGWVSG